MQVGFIAALEAEARTFRRREGALTGGGSYRVSVSGPGREQAARTAHELIADGCDLVVSWGVAGGLSEQLDSGDLVVTATAVTETGDAIALDQAAAARLIDCPGMPAVTGGPVLTVAEPLLGARDKRHFGNRFGALAVDMESTGIARVARSAGCPFVAVRAIADPFYLDVPAVALQGIDRRGRTRVHRIVTALSAEPRLLPALWRVGTHFRRAIATLKQAAGAITAPAS